MSAEKSSSLMTAGALAEKLGIPAGMVKKLIEAAKIQPEAVKGACKYYGAAALKKLQAAAKK